MKRLVPILLPMLFLIDCSKNDSNNPITEQCCSLRNNSFSIEKWKLTALKVGTVVQRLSPEKAFSIKCLSADLSFFDTDRLVGTWCMPPANTLVEVYTNVSSGRICFPDI